MGKLSSTKLVTSAKKVWDGCSRITETKKKKIPKEMGLLGTSRDQHQQK